MRLIRPVLALTAAAAALGAAALVPGSASAAVADDPFRAKQFGIDQVRAPAAWATSTGRGQVIAVVDTGVDPAHPDLRGQLVRGATFTCKGEPAPCGDGDHLGPNRKNDGDEHGTHVAGIAAAATGNGTGIAGVAPDAKIMPVKVLEEGSGNFAEIAAGIRWAVAHGADVVNLSLGAVPGAQALTYTGVISDVSEAVAHAREQGVVVVAAAGNDFQVPLCGTPAFEDGALCVTSTDKRELPSAFSNSGVKPDLLAVAAPGGSALPRCGEDVVSTVPAGTGRSSVCGYGTSYDEYAGTSMATPHVAGVAALLTAQGRTDEQVLTALTRTARQGGTDTTGLFTPEYGHGIVDAKAAVAFVTTDGPTTSSTQTASSTPTATSSPTTSTTATASSSPTATTTPTAETTKKPRPTRAPR